MTNEAEVKLDFKPTDTDDDLFRKVASAFHLPDQPLRSYPAELLLTLIGILFQIIRGLVQDTAKKENRLEKLNYEAKKSSKTSSMKPSSDGYAGVGSHKVDPDTLTEEESEKLNRRDHNRSSRKPSGKKPGHQPGVKSTGFHFSDNAAFEETKVIMPAHCIGCSRYCAQAWYWVF